MLHNNDSLSNDILDNLNKNGFVKSNNEILSLSDVSDHMSALSLIIVLYT